MWTAEEKSYIWLDSFLLDATEKNALINEAGSAVAVVKNFADFEERFAQKGRAELYEKMRKSLQDDAYFKGLISFYETQGITPVTRATDGYFEGWKAFPDAPCVLYVKGDVSLLKTQIFAVVGSRKIQDNYQKVGREICRDLAAHFTLITGVAEGGDEVAAEGGLQGGKVLCLLAGGFGEMPKDGGDFLQKVQKKGALLSVCPYEMAVRTYSYERRNKLLAACAKGVLVLSAGEKSGALKTAEHAIALQRPIFALPYSPSNATGAGCNALIKKGARLTENSFDISSCFGINLIEKAQTATLTAEEALVYERLKENGESHLTILSQAVGLPVFKTMAILSKLEVKGLVSKAGGNRFLAL